MWDKLASRKCLRRRGHIHIPRRSLADGSFCGERTEIGAFGA